MDNLRVGCRLKVFADDGVYEGLLHAVDLRGAGKDDRITLHMASCFDTGKSLPSLIHFYTSEIKKFEILNAPVSKSDVKQNETRLFDICSKLVPSHLKKLTNIDHDKLSASWQLGTNCKLGTTGKSDTELGATGNLSLSGCKTKEDGKSATNTESVTTNNSMETEAKVEKTQFAVNESLGRDIQRLMNDNQTLLEEDDSNENETEYMIIDKINQEFYDSIELIKKQMVIGLAVQGICISRKGQLCWLQIGIKKCWLFDILSLGREPFDKGLRHILESPTIQKVVYNCRCMSDMLWHKYEILLTNVFDIQVAEVAVFQAQNGGNLPRYVNSLPISLMEHMNLKEDDVFFQRSRVYNREKDESVWAHRPATEEMLDAAWKNVKHLCTLRCILMEKMLADFICGIDIYLHSLKDVSDKHFKTQLLKSDLLPKEFYRLQYKPSQRFYSDGRCGPLFIDNCNGGKDPVMQLSHDGISHGRRHTIPVKETSF